MALESGLRPTADESESTELVPAKRGHIRAYDPTVAMEVVHKVAEGLTLAEIGRLPGFPARQTFYRWLVGDKKLRDAYNAAKELSAEAFEEDALGLAKLLAGKASDSYTGTKVRAFEVAMSQYRWSAERRNPSLYGRAAADRIVVPIQINTTLDMGEGATYSPGAKPGAHDDPGSIYTFSAKVEVPSDAPPEAPTVEEPGAVSPPANPFNVPAKLATQKPRPARAKPRHKSEAATKATITKRRNRGKKDDGTDK